MAFEPKDNSGSLFKNTYKEHEKQPDYNGNAIIDGKPKKISAWIREGQKGKWISIAFTDKNDQPKKKPEKKFVFEKASQVDDEIPF